PTLSPYTTLFRSRGLAAARGTDQGAELAAADRERDVAQRVHRPGGRDVALGDALDDDQLAQGVLSISRAMTSRWTSDVPSPISVSLASRKMRSTGNSVM